MQVRTVVSRLFAENGLVVWLAGRRDCLIIDPGFDTAEFFEILGEEQLTPAAILNTHGHTDHIAGNAVIKERFPDAPIVIGQNDAVMLVDARANLSAMMGQEILSPPADVLVRDGQTWSGAGFDLEVREIPGHSPGHVVYVWRGMTPVQVFGGDVLFAGSVGRTDFPGGNQKQLFDGIRRKLFDLPDDTVVYPGHGPTTTIGVEKRTNPFVGELGKYRILTP